MRTTQQRAILESLGLEHLDGKSWLVMPRPPKGYAEFGGFDLGRPTWDRAGAVALTRVKDKFENDVVQDGLAPGNIEPIDVLDFFLSRRPMVTLDNGIILHAQDGLYEHVLGLLAARAVRILGALKFDIVTNIDSRKPLATDLAKAIASSMNKRFFSSGLLKTKDPERVTISKEVDKTIVGNLERFKHAIATNNDPSMRKAFHPRQRAHVHGYLEPSYDVEELITNPNQKGKDPARIVIVDDILTTGSSAREAKFELERLGYDVVATIAAFRADSRRA